MGRIPMVGIWLLVDKPLPRPTLWRFSPIPTAFCELISVCFQATGDPPMQPDYDPPWCSRLSQGYIVDIEECRETNQQQHLIFTVCCQIRMIEDLIRNLNEVVICSIVICSIGQVVSGGLLFCFCPYKSPVVHQQQKSTNLPTHLC